MKLTIEADMSEFFSLATTMGRAFGETLAAEARRAMKRRGRR